MFVLETRQAIYLVGVRSMLLSKLNISIFIAQIIYVKIEIGHLKLLSNSVFVERECSIMVRWVVGSILHGGLIEPVLHDRCNKGRGMCHPVCGMMHIKEPLLLIGKSSPCGGSGFPLSLSEWSFTMSDTI